MKKRIYYFDLLKVLGALAVVLIHVISEVYYTTDITSTNFKIMVILESLIRYAIPIYYMISGAIFLNEDFVIDNKKLYKKYILNLFLIYLFWNTSYTFLNELINNNIPFSINLILTSIKSTILGHAVFQFDFLLTILAFYVSLPILRLITKKKNKKEIEYLLLILFIFNSLIPLINVYLGIVIKYFIFFTSVVIFFILGYYLNTFEINKRITKYIYIASIISVILTIILTIKDTIKIGYPSELFFYYYSWNILIPSIGIFLYFKNKFKNTKKKVKKLLTSTYFGIYLIHGFSLGVAKVIGMYNINIPFILKILLITIFTYFLSFIASFIISKIPYVKKLIRG